MTYRSRCLPGLILGLALNVTPAAAQDDPRFALVASLPTPTVSFQWEASDRFALRVDGSYSYRDESTTRTVGSFSDRTTGITLRTETQTDATSHSTSIGLAGIFTIHRTDAVRLYVAPRVSLSFLRQRIIETTTVPELPPGSFVLTPGSVSGTATGEDSSTSPAASGSFGAEAMVHRRLGVFGEVGFTYTNSDAPIVISPSLASILDGEAQRTTVGTRAVVGVMVRF